MYLTTVDPDSFTVLWNTTVNNMNDCSAQYVDSCVVTGGNVYDGTTGKIVKNLEGSYNYATDVAFKKWGSELQPGVTYSDGKLYWADAMVAFICSVSIDKETGRFIDSSLSKNKLILLRPACR